MEKISRHGKKKKKGKDFHAQKVYADAPRRAKKGPRSLSQLVRANFSEKTDRGRGKESGSREKSLFLWWEKKVEKSGTKVPYQMLKGGSRMIEKTPFEKSE